MEWNAFWDKFPTSPNDIAEDDIDWFDAAAIPQCHLHLPTSVGLTSHAGACTMCGVCTAERLRRVHH
eukprot:4965549-Pleurochrysis_carterae.AAC.1